MRITFITPTLSVGGYEKVVVAYANELCRRSHMVEILCFQKTGELLSTVSENVQVIGLNVRARTLLLPLAKYLKEIRPDILYCAFREINLIGVLAKKMARVDTCIYATQHGFQTDRPIVAWLKGLIIGRADRLITVADGVADYESKQLGIDRNRFVVLNNPVLDRRVEVPDEHHPWFDEVEAIPIIVMAGRIAGDKGEVYGIDILAEMNKSRMVRMMYLGDGLALAEVKQHAKEKGVGDSIAFLGFVDNPMGYMKHCSLFLHTAIVEGFGNVVVEALYCNLTVCTTNCSGPLQIIGNGKYGVDLGSVYDEGFATKAARKIEQVLDGELSYEGKVERALCFEVEHATDQFLSCL